MNTLIKKKKVSLHKLAINHYLSLRLREGHNTHLNVLKPAIPFLRYHIISFTTGNHPGTDTATTTSCWGIKLCRPKDFIWEEFSQSTIPSSFCFQVWHCKLIFRKQSHINSEVSYRTRHLTVGMHIWHFQNT